MSSSGHGNYMGGPSTNGDSSHASGTTGHDIPRTSSPSHPLVASPTGQTTVASPLRQQHAGQAGQQHKLARDDHDQEDGYAIDSTGRTQHHHPGMGARLASYTSWDEELEGSDGTDSQQLEEEEQQQQRYKGGQKYSRLTSIENDDDDDEEEEMLGESDRDGRRNRQLQPGRTIDNDDGEEGEEDETAARRRRQRSSRRRAYGGGRGLASYYNQGDKGVLATAWSLLTVSIAPGMPLLVPYAFSLTGLSFGIPLLAILIALGTSFSHVILTVEARYVGSRGYPSLAAAVFPQAYGIKRVGQALILALSAFIAGARSLVALYISTDLIIDLFLHAAPRARILHSRVFVSLVLGLSFFLPALLLPRHRPLFTPSLFVSQLPSLSVLLYPIVLLIIGVSLKNLDDYPSLLKPNPHLGKPHWSSEPLHTPTLWSGVSVLFFACATNQQYTFSHYRRMRRSAAPSGRNSNDVDEHVGGGSANGAGRTGSSASSGTAVHQSPGTMNSLERLLNRHRWESATTLAALLHGLILAGFGTVGYVSLLTIQPDVFASLPRDHAWFNFARFLVLLTVLPLLTTTMEPCKGAFSSLLTLPRKLWWAIRGVASGHSYSHANRSHGRKEDGGERHQNGVRRRASSMMNARSANDEEDQEDDDNEDEDEEEADDLEPSPTYTGSDFSHSSPRRAGGGGRGRGSSSRRGGGPRARARAWDNRLAIIISWTLVIVLACLIRDLGAIAEIVGCVGGTWYGFILPAAFFITLFHVRSPRTIFMTSSSSAQIQTDALLLQKERQLQKRLMGRRLWMDLSTFGLLLPVGIVGFARGVWALASS